VGPDFGLPGVAAAGLVLWHRVETCAFQPLPCLVNLLGGFDLDAEVVDRRPWPVAGGVEDQLEGRGVDGEVGVSRLEFGGLDAEQPPVEVHGGV